MPSVYRTLTATTALMLACASCWAGGVSPEIQRPPDSGVAQPVGQSHTLRNIPEACVRLEGQFTGDPAAPYRLQAVPHAPCPQRAVYVDVSTLKMAPAESNGWILNDRISVPRADAPDCTAIIEVWRWPGHVAPPKLDAQGRSRIYLDKPQQPVDFPGYTSVLRTTGSCG